MAEKHEGREQRARPRLPCPHSRKMGQRLNQPGLARTTPGLSGGGGDGAHGRNQVDSMISEVRSVPP